MTPRHIYRAHSPANSRTSFIWAHTFAEAQASYARDGSNPDEAQWRDEGEVGPVVLDAEGWPVSIFDEAP